VESGGAVTGYVLAPNYEDRIVEGTASGGQITFVAEREANNNTKRRSNYSAVLEGGKLKLTMPAAGNRPPQVIEFTRASAQAPAPLAPAPPKIALAAPAPVRDNGLARTPPMGWNSWNKFQGKVSDKVVREMADAMAKNGMRDAGYLYVNIDDTWESARDSQGNIGTN
jgi:alpha-galactosidase